RCCAGLRAVSPGARATRSPRSPRLLSEVPVALQVRTWSSLSIGRASPVPSSALERRGRLGLSILRCQELEILILAVLNMIDAELRERPRICGLQQVEHQPMPPERDLSVVRLERSRPDHVTQS